MDNQCVIYSLIEGIYTLEAQEHKGYGISVNNKGTATPLLFHDISTNKNDVIKLVSLCNELQLDPIHIRDVIDDYLVSH